MERAGHTPPTFHSGTSMERLQLVGLHWCLVLVQMSERVLCPVMTCIVVGVDRLRFEARYGVELLDRRRAQSRERTKDRALDLSDLSILHGVNEGILRLSSMI